MRQGEFPTTIISSKKKIVSANFFYHLQIHVKFLQLFNIKYEVDI